LPLLFVTIIWHFIFSWCLAYSALDMSMILAALINSLILFVFIEELCILFDFIFKLFLIVWISHTAAGFQLMHLVHSKSYNYSCWFFLFYLLIIILILQFYFYSSAYIIFFNLFIVIDLYWFIYPKILGIIFLIFLKIVIATFISPIECHTFFILILLFIFNLYMIYKFNLLIKYCILYFFNRLLF